MTIDLHGLNVEEATAKLLNSLFQFENDNFENELIIITGKGKRIIELTVLNILDEENYKYKYLDGKIIIYNKIY